MNIPHQLRLPETIHDFNVVGGSKDTLCGWLIKQNSGELSEDFVVEENQRVQHEKTKSNQHRMIFPGVTMWRIVLEYFSRFRIGLPFVPELEDDQNLGELDFLKRTMLPDVVFNTERGAKAILCNWKRLSLWFNDVEVELDSLVEDLGSSLIATTTTSVTITQQTLENVFPHLCVENIESSSLARKLLDKRLVMVGSTRFEWDDEYSRVKSITSQSDMLTPILRLLGDLEGASRVFENAVISPEFQWRLST